MAKIVVMEDEVHIQKLIQIILEKDGHEVEAFSNGEAGLKGLKEGAKPNLILLDILMPGMDGLQVLKALKADPSLKDVPVVMLTALAQQNVVMQGIKLGAKDYIRKPFHPQDLISRLKKHFAA